jgi:hypothetical protein
MKLNFFLTLAMLISASVVSAATESTPHECIETAPAIVVNPCTKPKQAPPVKRQAPVRRTVKQPAPAAPEPRMVQQQNSDRPIIIERRDQSPIIIRNNNINNNIIDSYNDNDESDYRVRPRNHKKKAKPKKRVNSDISLYGHGGFFSRVSGISVEAEARSSHFGLGLFFDYITARNLRANNGILSGDQIGLALHYHFAQFNSVHNYGKIDPGIYAEGAFGRYDLLYYDSIVSGIAIGAGFDLAYPVSPNVNLYGKAGVNFLRYESQTLYTGESLSLGIRYDF